MPTVMMGHEMSRRPVPTGRPEKSDALLVPVRSPHHMGQRMRRPGVARIAGERLPARVLRALEIPRFLEPESVKPKDKARERIVSIPGRQHPLGAGADSARPAEKEIGVLRRRKASASVGCSARMVSHSTMACENSPFVHASAAPRWRCSRSVAHRTAALAARSALTTSG
jgi:hypothetical protein